MSPLQLSVKSHMPFGNSLIFKNKLNMYDFYLCMLYFVWKEFNKCLKNITDLVLSMMSSFVSDEGKEMWRCDHCLYESKKKFNVLEHIESKHIASQELACPYCDKICPNRKSLRNHVYYHKKWKRNVKCPYHGNSQFRTITHPWN